MAPLSRSTTVDPNHSKLWLATWSTTDPSHCSLGLLIRTARLLLNPTCGPAVGARQNGLTAAERAVQTPTPTLVTAATRKRYVADEDSPRTVAALADVPVRATVVHVPPFFDICTT